MAKPIAVLISDIHYFLPTLEVADAAMRLTIAKANDLEVPLVVAGDLHDTKANMRAECVNRMLETFKLIKHTAAILRGNHDAINEKSSDHSLHFLKSKEIYVIESPSFSPILGAYLIPYTYDVENVRTYLAQIPRNSKVIMHQGLQGSDSGEYYVDHTALKHEDVAHLNVISGHYHRRQTIDTGKGHTFSYIGNPYTLGFGEANHPEKGFQILMSDGSLEFVPTNLRKHVIIDMRKDYKEDWPKVNDNDLLWFKAGTLWDKAAIAKEYGFKQDFRFEAIHEEIQPIQNNLYSDSAPQAQILDDIIDSLSNTEQDAKNRVKALWKDLK